MARIGKQSFDRGMYRARISLGGWSGGLHATIGTLYIPKDGPFWLISWRGSVQGASYHVLMPDEALEMIGDYITDAQAAWLKEVSEER